MPPAEPVERDEYLVPSSPRSGSTGAGTAARMSRSELEMRGKQSRDIKAGREKPQSSFGTLDLQQGFSEKMDLNYGQNKSSSWDKRRIKRLNGNEKQNKKPFGQVILIFLNS